jgi:hypothetical protein
LIEVSVGVRNRGNARKNHFLVTNVKKACLLQAVGYRKNTTGELNHVPCKRKQTSDRRIKSGKQKHKTLQKAQSMIAQSKSDS